MSKIIQPPVGILICHPKQFFVEYNKEKWLAKMEELNTKEDACWYRVMKNLPTQDFLYIYTAYDGLVQHRTNLGWMERNKTLRFPRPEGGIRTFENANAIVLTGPFVKAPYEITQKGFQGFHYVYKQLW